MCRLTVRIPGREAGHSHSRRFKAPMYVMRGAMPIRSMSYYMNCWWLKYGVRMFGKWMIPSVPFKEAYFLEDALKFRAALPDAPLIYVGGLVSRQKIDEVLDSGFDAVQMARALLNEPGFVNRMKQEEQARCNCGHSNYCIGRMYTIEMACHQHLKEQIPSSLQKEIDKLEKKCFLIVHFYLLHRGTIASSVRNKSMHTEEHFVGFKAMSGF